MVRAIVRQGIRSPKVILALLTALNLLNYLDRTVLSAVLAPVQDDLHLSNFVAGWLPTIFLIGYFATSPVFGTLGDRVPTGGRTKLIALGIAVWSAATVASGLAQGTGSMVASRAFVGLGEASYATLAPTLIDDLAPANQKSRWMAIFYSATPIGSALGYLVGGAVLHAHGWRTAFFVAGGPGLAIALLCLLIVEPARAAVVNPPDWLASAKELLRVPLYRGTVLGYCAYTFALGGFGYWAPAYLHKQYGIEAGHASVVFGLVTVVGGLVGTLLGGALADRAARAGVRRAEAAKGAPLGPRELDDAIARGNVSIPALGAALGAPLAGAAIAAATASMFFKMLLPTEIALFLMSGPINVAILRSAPPALRASAMALSIFAIHALGDLWSPPLIGLVADHAPMQLAMFAGPLVFAFAAIVWFQGRSYIRPVDLSLERALRANALLRGARPASSTRDPDAKHSLARRPGRSALRAPPRADVDGRGRRCGRPCPPRRRRGSIERRRRAGASGGSRGPQPVRAARCRARSRPFGRRPRRGLRRRRLPGRRRRREPPGVVRRPTEAPALPRPRPPGPPSPPFCSPRRPPSRPRACRSSRLTWSATGASPMTTCSRTSARSPVTSSRSRT